MPADTVFGPALAAVSLYAGLNGLILLALAMNCGRVRQAEKVFMGDGGNPRMIRAMRGQANWVEFAPMGLLMLALTAFAGAPVWVVHLLGITLTLGRALHAWHFIQADAPGWQRGGGAGLTALMILLTALGLIGHGVLEL